ncbi:SDR family oxidoreductase [Pseudomonas donghuensis]|uniref:SDR family oxidoreductase n=1 Tax=Pseudomonas donghuensis TaxID=1163398 RepID=A0AAP0X986_9PSED|nr:SDR family oxidoreductase [Pseudomonas donghuensis]MDF9893531.1 nucleoside-diphosphate-sugar epimerase [Pseudomonas vranovensis]KDN98868.1 SDR family oxidoreductase [Pseudomonas donghuensis]MBF4209776.1 NAD-dependent epimerase/dehydratase family protein [Pseudomonas donghuensis]MCP6694614.1 SDR family oxidoreductase [Pseudomonas donghuensis]MCP6698058.1 SDR family oxidoreductase [Pseudomonas donghuensis]
MRSAFVTGATGLLGNNLVRELVARGYAVKALVRSRAKGQLQFADLPSVELVVGDMADVTAFAPSLQGCDTVFHTAAFFRDNYKGGSHWKTLEKINVTGTHELIHQAYRAGIRRFIHTSSIAVLDGAPGSPIDETCLRAEADADDYYRSKILADRVVLAFLQAHPEMHACMILPGWMWGPGDIGPTSSGQLIKDVVNRKLPGLIPGTFSVVDARDVALAHIVAADKGRRGERYLAAGRNMTMRQLVPILGRVAGVKTPVRQLPLPALYLLATVQELYARLTGKPILLSMATLRLLIREEHRTCFDHRKSEEELGLTFRGVERTITETIAWYREHGWIEKSTAREPRET